MTRVSGITLAASRLSQRSGFATSSTSAWPTNARTHAVLPLAVDDDKAAFLATNPLGALPSLEVSPAAVPGGGGGGASSQKDCTDAPSQRSVFCKVVSPLASLSLKRLRSYSTPCSPLNCGASMATLKFTVSLESWSNAPCRKVKSEGSARTKRDRGKVEGSSSPLFSALVAAAAATPPPPLPSSFVCLDDDEAVTYAVSASLYCAVRLALAGASKFETQSSKKRASFNVASLSSTPLRSIWVSHSESSTSR
mmetsp:Transcript_8722/g.17745  ORF Transcript_8722/g.17745 Transcript_8722/m.17745 type:complete len:252 (-) Transcript_8722:612-1367(-)